MLERLCSRDVFHLLLSEQPERSAAGSQDDARDAFEVFTRKALEYGRMFAVNGQDGRMMAVGELRDEFARHDEGLLVRQCDGLLGFYGSNGGA